MPLVFDAKPNSGYDDRVLERYHFPNRYRPSAERGVGDWIVYRKPRRGDDDRGYFAVALLAALEPDPTNPNASYARIERFLPFETPVPQKDVAGRAFEAILRSIPPRECGATIQGRSIRPIGAGDFAAIVLAGLRETFDPQNPRHLGLDAPHLGPETSASSTRRLKSRHARFARSCSTSKSATRASAGLSALPMTTPAPSRR
jgi:putative restriction endonuclease